MEKLRIVVGGFIGFYPTGGATWDYIQYPIGLKMLGHEVYYLEDTSQYPIYQKEGGKWDDCTSSVEYLKKAMEGVGMEDDWAYRDVVSGQLFGMSEAKLRDICKTADVLINVSSSTMLRDEYQNIPIKIFIDTDPMFTQHQFYLKQQEGGIEAQSATDYYNAHNLLFTFGLNINEPDCRIPKFNYNWLTTKKPICLKYWEEGLAERPVIYGFTSVMNWVERPDFMFAGECWGQKNKVFRDYFQLPLNSGKRFEMVINRPSDAEADPSIEFLKECNWGVLNPDTYISNKDDYRAFVQSSFAEFSVTKETFIKSRSGWFSGRSAVYLASGKPVVTQDTQWSRYIPSGEGLFAVHDLDSATEAVKEISGNYKKHSKAASEIAWEYFDSEKVLSAILSHVN